MVVARFSEDGATVLFVDFGESEQQPVDIFKELPGQFRDLEPLAERVKLEGWRC